MDKLRYYDIPFKGLKEGKHDFDYAIEDSFFELFEQPLVEKGNVEAKVKLNKGSALMSLDFHIKGEVETVCDTCLEPLMVNVEYEAKVYVKFGEEYEEPTEEIIVLPHEANNVNVAQLIYEFICVGLPIRHVHPEDENGNLTCDSEMLDRLNDYLVEEASDDEQDDYIDPRWDALRKIVDKNK